MSYRGRCPLCSGQLNVADTEVICENGDYKASVFQFEKRWTEHEDEMLQLTEKLLEDLKSYNLVNLN